MILSMTEQVRLFLFTVVMGVGVGFIYDFLRLFRRLVKHSVLVCNIEDGLFWIGVLVVVFYFMLNKNYGEIRFFSIMGFFIGMVVYLLTVSKMVLGLLLKISLFLKQIFIRTLKIILYPVRIIVNFLKIPYSFILSIYRNLSKQSKKVLHNSQRYAKIKGRKIKQDIRIMLKKT